MTKRFFIYAIILLRLGLLSLGLHQAWYQDWTGVFVVAQAILISFLPKLLWKFYKIKTPLGLQLSIILFICATLILGEIADFYNKFWWWDLALHFVAGVGITLIAFIALLIVFKQIDMQAAPLFATILAVSFSLAVALIWEIYEFIIDLFFITDSPMQLSNEDTMTDLLVAVVGSLLVGVFGYRYIRWRKTEGLSQVIHDGVEDNQ